MSLAMSESELDARRRILRGRIANGQTLDQLDAVISTVGGDEEQRSALWLYAWDQTARRDERRRTRFPAYPGVLS
jgi:hypothetical protein